MTETPTLRHLCDAYDALDTKIAEAMESVGRELDALEAERV